MAASPRSAAAGRARGRPLYTQQGNLVNRRSVGPAQYGRFLVGVFEDWVRRDIGAVYLQMFDTALARIHGEPGGNGPAGAVASGNAAKAGRCAHDASGLRSPAYRDDKRATASVVSRK